MPRPAHHTHTLQPARLQLHLAGSAARNADIGDAGVAPAAVAVALARPVELAPRVALALGLIVAVVTVALAVALAVAGDRRAGATSAGRRNLDGAGRDADRDWVNRRSGQP